MYRYGDQYPSRNRDVLNLCHIIKQTLMSVSSIMETVPKHVSISMEALYAYAMWAMDLILIAEFALHICLHNLLSNEISFVSDKNECVTSNGNCSQACINTIGSYFCSCNSGYVLIEDRMTCNGKSKIVSTG